MRNLTSKESNAVVGGLSFAPVLAHVVAAATGCAGMVGIDLAMNGSDITKEGVKEDCVKGLGFYAGSTAFATVYSTVAGFVGARAAE